MVSGPDPVESLVHAVRGALSPIEAGFSRAARDLESHLRSSRGRRESRVVGETWRVGDEESDR
ncbi:hypothetical protein ACMD2_13066 [Ananas comosus]|uniref:Uncharacterized protein n=1 Tax=Ananas comosus TaxID=4615 RepID=A0A199UVE8_ANACO|nr:hypothetical protein ACMD2_13066 [Ananas comosus]